MACPKCGEALAPLQIERTNLEQCPACQGLWIGRAALLELRDISPSAHPLLAATSALQADPAAGELEGRSCARCGQHLSTYHYRGGKTKVESCKRCDQLFLDPGELGQILKEWRDGLEMSDDKRVFLRSYREQSAWRRMLDSKLGLGSLALGAVVLFLVLAVGWEDYGFGSSYRRYSLPLPLALAVAAGWYLLRRRRLKGEQRSARKVIRKLGREARDASSARPVPGRPALPREAPAEKKTASCPWCNAPIAADASRCPACDSDVF